MITTSFKTLLAVFLFTAASCVAQTMVGLQAGVNWSGLHTNSGTGDVYGTGSGSNFGLLVQSKMSNNFYLIGSLIYIKKTVPWLIHPYLMSSGPDIEFQFEFTQFSASVKKEFPVYDFHPYIIGGGSFGYLNSGSFLDSRFGPTYTGDLTSNLNRSDLDLNLGLGLAYSPLERMSIFIDVKYSYDLLNLSKNSGSFVNTKTTQLWCGILFGV
jgi:hypothetical protein